MYAQECEWLNSIGEVSSPQTIISSTASTKGNNIIAIGYFVDTITIGSNQYKSLSSTENASFIVKYNDKGDVLWSKSFINLPTAAHDGIKFGSLAIDNDGAIIISGLYTNTVDFGNGIRITAPPNTGANLSYNEGFIVKLDSNGLATWATTLIPTGLGGQIIHWPNIKVDNSDNIVASLTYHYNFTFSGTSIVMNKASNHGDICAIKYSPNGTLMWAKRYSNIGEDFANNISVDNDNNLYISGRTERGFTFGSQTLSRFGVFILKIDSMGNPINGKLFSNLINGTYGGYIGIPSAVYPDGKFVLAGVFSDSIDFGNKIKLHKTGNSVANAFIAFFDSSFNCRWAIKDNPLIRAQLDLGTHIEIRNQYIYLGGSLSSGKTKFGIDTLSSPNVLNSNYNSSAFIAKIDTNKNILWAYTTPCYQCVNNIANTTTDDIGNVYASGVWHDSLNFFGLGYKTNNSTSNVIRYGSFIGKIPDITITRGNVYAGPYCSGDTILIPFTKTGTFEFNNEFIAELSDSAGNFDSGWRELGRIKDTLGGVIKGVLPLFNIATGGRYRVRIRSTAPSAQSFYKRDSLRLLIFSKDSADAGPDITLCNGQSVQLGTKGGSIWQWSPPHFFNNDKDTSKRFPIITPDSTTEYRIVISDSVGCGLVDTDYVKITVRPPLTMSRLDTVYVCNGRPYTFSPTLTGGDSSKYTLSVVARDSIFSASPSTYVTVKPNVPRTYLLFFSDSCSKTILDTITIVPKSGVNFTGNYDTVLCKGDSITITPQINTCDPGGVKYLWNNGLGEGKTKKLSPLVTTQYQVIALDTVNLASDTLLFTANIIPKIELQLSNDTTLCVGNAVNLEALTTGGDTATLSFLWAASGSSFSATTPTISLQANITDTFTIIASDKCAANSDTGEIKVIVHDSLKVSLPFSDTILCFGNTISLPANGIGGLQSNYTYTWQLPDNTTANSKNLVITPSVGISLYSIYLTDGCTNYTDSFLVKVTVLPALKAELANNINLCFGNAYTLYATATGGKSKEYRFSFITSTGTIINADSLAFVAQTSTQYKLVVSDACSKPSFDTATINVNVLPQLVQTLNTSDTTICFNTPLILKTSVTGGKTNNYDYEWHDDKGTFLSNQPSVSITSPTSTKIIITVSDNCSTPIIDTVILNVLPKPKASFTLQDTVGCPPLNVTFTDASSAHQQTKNTWFANGTAISLTNNQYSFTKSGIYTIELIVANDLNCSDGSTKVNTIKVYPKPTARFTSSPVYNEMDKVVFLHNQSSGANKYTWWFGNGNSLETLNKNKVEYTYNDSGSFNLQLVAFNALQCSDTATSKLVIHPPFTISIPNAFTPNGDGLNDVFSPIVSQAKNFNLKIWNRWGQVLHNCDSPCGWDGTYNSNPVETGSYIYIISFLSNGNEKRTVSGSIQLIR